MVRKMLLRALERVEATVTMVEPFSWYVSGLWLHNHFLFHFPAANEILKNKEIDHYLRTCSAFTSLLFHICPQDIVFHAS